MRSIFSNSFIILVERWLVIPLLGYLISHGFFSEQESYWLTPVLDNVFATAFVIIGWLITHPRHAVIQPIPDTGEDTTEYAKVVRVFGMQVDLAHMWQLIHDYVIKVEYIPVEPKPEVASMKVTTEYPPTTQ